MEVYIVSDGEGDDGRKTFCYRVMSSETPRRTEQSSWKLGEKLGVSAFSERVVVGGRRSTGIHLFEVGHETVSRSLSELMSKIPIT
ncbi:hypothetical protein SESBI_31829 [Sesbania bispinosa]|nr:hypothetical protein SESBI_31829 [Sesbania bispinosa]